MVLFLENKSTHRKSTKKFELQNFIFFIFTFFDLYLPGISVTLGNQDTAYSDSVVGIEFKKLRIVLELKTVFFFLFSASKILVIVFFSS